MTITAKDLEGGAEELTSIDVRDLPEIRGAVALLGGTLYIIGAALVSAIDRNTEARKGERERTET